MAASRLRHSLVLALALTALAPALARAEACPGSGPRPCPYVSAAIVGHRAEGVLRFPEAVALDAQGDVYVADQLSYVVQKFSAAGAFETEWGSFGAGHGQFGPIGGLAVDAAGDVYVVDSSHNRIQKFDANGDFITSWGRHGSEVGQFDFGSSENPSQPPGGGIAVAGGYVYVADSGNDRIERFDLQGGEAMAWGTKGSAPGQFSYPRGVAANGSVVIVSDDDNHRLEQFDANGDFQAAVGTQGAGPGQFGFPYGVALDAAGNVYVADDINHRVVKLTPQLAFAGAWGGFGTHLGQLAFPRALASDPAGDTYVANTANDRVEVYDPQGNFLRTIGTSARGPGQLTLPRGMAADPTGRLLVSDTVGNRVETFAPGGQSYLEQWTAAGGSSLHFDAPAGLAVDPHGSVYLADRGNARLVRYWGDGTYLGEVGGPAALGGAGLSGAGSVAVASGPDLAYVADSGHNRILVYGPTGALAARWGANGGDGSAGSAPGAFDRPQAVAVDGAGNAYVADTGNDRVVKLSPAGAVLAEWGGAGAGEGRFRSPTGIAVDAAGRVYVVDGEDNRVEVFDANGRYLLKWGARGAGLGQLSQPTAIALDCNGSVYVADTHNNRLQRFDMAAPAAVGCLTPGAWPPPLDVTPLVSVALPRRQGVLARRALALTVSCQRGCRVRVSASLAALAHPRRRVALAVSTRSLPAVHAGHVRLLVRARALAALRAALGSSRAMRARVTVLAIGPTGRRKTLHRTYLVTR